MRLTRVSKSVSFVFALVFSVSASVTALADGRQFGPDGRFPLHPNTTMTPGSVCTTGQTHRYPEGVTYCNRDVARDLKRDLFRRYDVNLGYETQVMNRQDFKIDHYIPLCAGGSNQADNLWPQHKSVYMITDPIEPLVCAKMSAGRLKQADAIKLVRRAKLDLKQVGAVMSELNSL